MEGGNFEQAPLERRNRWVTQQINERVISDKIGRKRTKAFHSETISYANSE